MFVSWFDNYFYFLIMPSGFMLINKFKNWTSHDVVAKMRKITGINKIGHTGTLDPFATGLLILLIGQEMTKKQSFFLQKDKTYLAKIHLGAESNTDDLTGQIKNNKVEKIPESDRIKKTLKIFIGEIKQVPPAFSAKKIKGQKAYQLARRGEKVELKPKKIKIYQLDLIFYQWPYLIIRAKVSAGTYLRSLARDLGQKLSVGGYLEELNREEIGNYNLKEAIELEKITRENWKNFLLSPKII